MEDNERKGIYIYIHGWVTFSVQQKLTEHCKSTVIEKIKILKKISFKKYSVQIISLHGSRQPGWGWIT